MIIGELLVLLAILSAASIGVAGFLRMSNENKRFRRALEEALVSGDYVKIDAFLAAWSDRMPKKLIERIEAVRTDCYLLEKDRPSINR